MSRFDKIDIGKIMTYSLPLKERHALELGTRFLEKVSRNSAECCSMLKAKCMNFGAGVVCDVSVPSTVILHFCHILLEEG